MRSSRALALTLLGGLLAACGQGVAPTGSTSPAASGAGSFHTETVVGDVRLAAGIRTGPRESRSATAPGQVGLVIEYELVDTGTSSVLVLDRVPEMLGSGVLPRALDPERAWVYSAGGRVRVSKQGFSPAPGVRFVAAPVIGARLLEADGHLSGRAWVPLPLTLDVPGTEFEAPREPVDPQATEVEFCVQLGPATGGRPSSVDPTVLEVPAAAPSARELICAPALPLPRV